MGRHHDLGGRAAGPVERDETTSNHWQKRMEAMRDNLARRRDPVMRVDEMRRAIEDLDPAVYDRLTPYQRKAAAIRDVLVEKGVLDPAELKAEIAWRRREREKDRAVETKLAAAAHADHAHAQDAAAPIDEFELISEAMIAGLTAKGLLHPDELRRGVERAEAAGPAIGAEIVARAWLDPGFKARLLSDAKPALAEIGVTALEAGLGVLENTAAVHNLVVCTLCSCYPRSILGSPPAWYVGTAYRARAVREPRLVLAEFGLQLSGDVEVRVHDSTADWRYMVLPMRPEGTEGWSGEKLKRLVTRDSLIGVARALDPESAERP